MRQGVWARRPATVLGWREQKRRPLPPRGHLPALAWNCLTDDLFRTFMVCVGSSGRLMHEFLAPAAAPRGEDLYDGECVGTIREAVARDALVDARRCLHGD